jgi:two-component system chemotaxis response regulator CheB
MGTFEKVIVIGASAGGVESLCQVVGGLSPTFAGVILVGLHLPRSHQSSLPAILSSSGPVPARHARDGETLEVGTIYVAPPDCDLMLETGSVAVKKCAGGRPFCPLIDALFQSAAPPLRQSLRRCGPFRVAGRWCSGTAQHQRSGGIAVVQDPADALFDSMPANASRHVQVDYSLPAALIGPLLSRLSHASTPAAFGQGASLGKPFVQVSVNDAIEDSTAQDRQLEDLTGIACAECRGALFRVHVAESRASSADQSSSAQMADEQTEGSSTQSLVQSLEERVMLYQHLTRHLEEQGTPGRAHFFRRQALELEERSNQLRRTRS